MRVDINKTRIAALAIVAAAAGAALFASVQPGLAQTGPSSGSVAVSAMATGNAWVVVNGQVLLCRAPSPPTGTPRCVKAAMR